MLTPEEADAIAAEFKRGAPLARGRYALTREDYNRLELTRPLTDTVRDSVGGALARGGEPIVPTPPPSTADLQRRYDREYRKRRQR